LQRHLEAGGKARKGVAADAESSVARCITTGEMKRQDYETCTMIAQPVPYDLFQITAPVNRQNRKPGDPCHTLARDNAAHAAVAIGLTTCETPKFAHEVQPTLTVPSPSGGGQPPAVAFHPLQDPISSTDGSTHCMGTGSSRGDATIAVAVAPSRTATNDPSRSPQSSEVTQQVAAVHASTMTVRRLSPRECERLQGFPDDWTLIPWRKKQAEDCPDGPRYRALGNSMAVNCMAWIGERIAAYEACHER
jgi:DNA (cytosine-5)-methyltransferase 1